MAEMAARRLLDFRPCKRKQTPALQSPILLQIFFCALCQIGLPEKQTIRNIIITFMLQNKKKKHLIGATQHLKSVFLKNI